MPNPGNNKTAVQATGIGKTTAQPFEPHGGTPCEVCGNEYDKPLDGKGAGDSLHYFDSFECAISALTPTCSHCKCRIIGHGVESGETFLLRALCFPRRGHFPERPHLRACFKTGS